MDSYSDQGLDTVIDDSKINDAIRLSGADDSPTQRRDGQTGPNLSYHRPQPP